MTKIKQSLPFILAIFVLAFAVYANAIRNDFNFDDDTLIRNNTLIRSLSNLPRILVSNYWANTAYEKGVLLYRPLVMATFAVDYACWGNNPAGFHLTNVMINALDAALLLVLLTLLFGDRVRPVYLLLGALLFALHPVHTEAVNMVVGRTELLAAMFGLLLFICHVNGWRIVASVCFFLALLSKESAITVPVMIFLFEWLARRKMIKAGYLGYAAMAALYLVIRFAVLRGFVAAQQTGILDRQDALLRAWTVIKVLGYYLKLLVLPMGLTPDYSDVALPRSPLTPWVIVPLVAILALLITAWSLRKTRWVVTFAMLWFFVTILPVSNIISIGAFLGERFMYLPAAALAFLAAGLFYHARTVSWQPVFTGCLVLIAGGFAAMTVDRNFAWRNADTLWADVAVHQPDNARANYFMGVKAETDMDYVRALEFYEHALKVYPDHNWNPDHKTVAAVQGRVSHVCYEMALDDYRGNKFDQSLAHAQQAVTADGKNAEAYVIIGNVYVQSNDFGRAAESYRAALTADPNQYEAKENLKRVQPYLKP